MLIRTSNGLYEFNSVSVEPVSFGGSEKYTLRGKNHDRLNAENLISITGSKAQMSRLLDTVIKQACGGVFNLKQYDTESELINMLLITVRVTGDLVYQPVYLLSDLDKILIDAESMGYRVYGLSLFNTEDTSSCVVVDVLAGGVDVSTFEEVDLNGDKVAEFFELGGQKLSSDWEYVLGDIRNVNTSFNLAERRMTLLKG